MRTVFGALRFSNTKFAKQCSCSQLQNIGALFGLASQHFLKQLVYQQPAFTPALDRNALVITLCRHGYIFTKSAFADKHARVR